MSCNSHFIAALLFAGMLLFTTSCQEPPKYTEGLSVEEALQKFEIREGFTIEPYATEPYVQSPVDMIVDENGDAYVVEMDDYPYQADSLHPKGIIKFLRDTDGDGRVDSAVVFADRLPSATSITPWKGGLLVAAAPEIIYLRDTTGDHRADIREVLFTGFFDRNSEAQITSFRFAVDNWIYANNNGQAGQVSRTDNPAAGKLNVAGGDFRFRLDNNRFETESGNGQFGLAIDDWGNRFFTQNTLYIQQAPVAGRYLKRHPFLPPFRASVKLYENDVMFQKTPPPYWRAERSRRRQQNFDSLGVDRTEWAEGHFTGASGGTFYGGDAFPDDYYGSIFTGEVAGNLVHRTVLKKNKGKAEFEAIRGAGEEDREFLSSTDPWFRPVNLYVAPDGYLYVIDMYLQHIETPVSIPDDLKAEMDFKKGNDKGRIYRIVPNGVKKPYFSEAKPGSKSSGQLAEYLAHPNQWWRLTAQRLILERQDKSVIPVLRTQFHSHTDPRARLHTLYALDGLGAVDASLARAALKDAHEGVRVHGAILSERFPANLPDLAALAGDSDDRVVLQAALSLGQFQGTRGYEAFAAILAKYAAEPAYRIAILSSEAGSSQKFIDFLARKNFFTDAPANHKFLEEAAFVVAARGHSAELAGLLNSLPAYDASGQKAIVDGVGKGFRKAKTTYKNLPSLARIIETAQTKAAGEVRPLLDSLSASLKSD